MSVDLSSLSPKARASYIRIGRRYGSGETLAQADRTITALGSYAVHLVAHGFGPADVQRLEDVQASLVAAGVSRAGAKQQKGVHSTTFGATMSAARTCRQSVRSVLTSVRRDLDEAGGAESTVTTIDTALKQTRVAPGDPRQLAEQLEVLRDLLMTPAVAAAATDRGGPDVVTSAEELSVALRAQAAGRSGPGTPEATETLDVLDGMAVTLARSAFKAARAAARKLGMPAMAKAFDLAELRESRSDTPGPAPQNDPAAPEPTVG